MIRRSRYVIAVQDLARSADYYRDVLGFEVHEIGDPGWRMFVRDACVIMAGECRDALAPAALGDHSYFAYLEVDAADALYAELRGRKAELVKPLRDEPWGMREFGIRTVDGHRIMFGAQREAPQIESAAPVFVVADLQASLACYRDALGFDVEFVYGEPAYYAGVERDAVLIHLQAAHAAGRAPGGATLNLFVRDVDALYDELRRRSAKLLDAPRDTPWGMRNLHVVDLDGNHLCFGMVIATRSG